MNFEPQVGDKVEFVSDRQTEKGPSSGLVVAVEDDQVAIRHSDTVEWFRKGRINVRSFRTISKGLKQELREWKLA